MSVSPSDQNKGSQIHELKTGITLTRANFAKFMWGKLCRYGRITYNVSMLRWQCKSDTTQFILQQTLTQGIIGQHCHPAAYLACMLHKPTCRRRCITNPVIRALTGDAGRNLPQPNKLGLIKAA